jgi:EAL domain-containing protein (putative c-di-GMP-specific phosphodiesterase class I)/GGDEF domain-containing protein
MLRVSNKNKLIVSFVTLLLIGLIASTTVAYLHVKSGLEIAIQDELQLKAKFVAAELNHWTKGTIEQVEHFALHLELLEGDLQQHPNFDFFLKRHPNNYALEHLGYVIDRNGYYRITDWQPPETYDPRNRPWYIEGKLANSARFGKPYISVDSEKAAWLAVTAPIEKEGKFIGLAAAHIRFNYVLSMLRDLDVGMMGKAFLVDQYGNLDLPSIQNIDLLWLQDVKNIIKLGITGDLTLSSDTSEQLFYITKSIDHIASRIVFAVPKKAIAQKIYQDTLLLLIKFLIIFLTIMISLYLSNRHLLAPIFNYLELDSVTHLPSKKHAKQQISQTFLQTEKPGRLLIINMENFNRITATYPAEHVSLLQNLIKERIQLQLTTHSLLGNFSESRYIAYYQLNDETNNNLLDNIAAELAKLYEMASGEIYCNFRMGVCDFPAHGKDVETLIDNAFSALASVNRQHNNSFAVFTPKINQQFHDAQQIYNAMKKGLDAEEFTMVYQPQVSRTSGTMFAVESLVRWYSTTLGRNISPVEFIPIAESNGLMVSLGNSIIKQVFCQISQWNEQGLDIAKISINISPQQLLAEHFFENLMSNIEQFSVPPAQIELEITETSLLKDPNTSIAILNKLSERGFSIAIDDFGTGYSSLEYLNMMPLHKLKIDRSFIIDLDKKAKSAVLVKTIIAMANNLNLEVLAEGVENEAEANTLQAMGCDKIQGYLYSKPLTAIDLASYMCKISKIEECA